MKTLIIPLALVAIAASVPASAKQELDVRTATVGFADLDLASARGQAEMNSRITIAARRVCDEPGLHSARASAEERACRQEAQARVAPTVTRLASAAGQSDGAAGAALAAPVGTVAP